MISTDPNFNLDDKIDEIKAYVIKDPVMCVTTKEVLHYKGDGFKVALIDLGLKKNIVRSLLKRGCDVHVSLPIPKRRTSLRLIRRNNAFKRTGDPKDCVETIETIKKLMGKKPCLASALGISLQPCNGADTEKLKYGHRGANHPVKDLEKDLTYITSQTMATLLLSHPWTNQG